ncbi:protein quiver [Drosophila sechellia]|uniref:GM11260 n=1 Tax=Drosophila sechellia TaxID=7238 RepID=B4IDZ0_DROSE|nr:protein quiver [Drosophila sechellia]EDW45798.1 GM11260 [Drosophila sechellia]
MQFTGHLLAVIFLISLVSIDGLLRRCYQCRSRGELGSCKDPFTFNATDVEQEPGVAAIPCASGWCGKVIEGGGTYAIDDYDLAIQRMCVQRGPDDNMDRCADTIYNYKKVYMCFCQGDLCNGARSWSSAPAMILIPVVPLIASWLLQRMRN